MQKWYENSFGEDYLIVYQHRNQAEAEREVKEMIMHLDVPSGAHVLDLCCGTGRHSIALSQMGYQVTGVDLSTVLIEKARKHAGASTIHFVHGDMRRIPLENMFEAIVNLFTSFGYFDEDEENEQVLKEIYRLLKPNGKFLIDYLNPTYVVNHLIPESHRQVGNLKIHEFRQIEESMIRKQITIEDPFSPNRIYHEQVKLYHRDTFEKMLRKVNLQVDHVFGDVKGLAFDEKTSKRMILIGHKPDGSK
jgi:ubiquinone/menaquinone biosynthesis C-methylase UbiE